MLDMCRAFGVFVPIVETQKCVLPMVILLVFIMKFLYHKFIHAILQFKTDRFAS